MSSTCSMRFRHILLAAFFTPDQFIAPTTVFLGLAYKTPLANVSGSFVEEPTIGGYGRVPVPLDSGHWTLSGFGEVATIADTVFSTPSEEWGLLTSWVMLDSPLGGDLLAAGNLVVPTYFVAGQDPPILAAGGVSVGLYD